MILSINRKDNTPKLKFLEHYSEAIESYDNTIIFAKCGHQTKAIFTEMDRNFIIARTTTGC